MVRDKENTKCVRSKARSLFRAFAALDRSLMDLDTALSVARAKHNTSFEVIMLDDALHHGEDALSLKIGVLRDSLKSLEHLISNENEWLWHVLENYRDEFVKMEILTESVGPSNAKHAKAELVDMAKFLLHRLKG